MDTKDAPLPPDPLAKPARRKRRTPSGVAEAAAAKAARAAKRAAKLFVSKRNRGKAALEDGGAAKAGLSAHKAEGEKGGEASTAGETTEKRAARYRDHPTQKTVERAQRVLMQRMFMVDREAVGNDDAPLERFKVLGSTGNVYTTIIGHVPQCDCPDFGFGNKPCKHIIFVFLKVLKLPMSNKAWFQAALLTDELRAVFAAAPPTPCASVSVSGQVRTEYLRATGVEVEEKAEVVGKRIESVGDDCPVCYEEMSEVDNKSGKLVYDESVAGCGKALHAECFNMWAATANRKGDAVTCVWCRAPWPVAGASNGGAKKSKFASGYLNMADVAGISRTRDTSSYYHGPMRGRATWEPRYDDE
ncbi:hypothetical protein Q5752_001653 [Cryptotrichosporon argae]